MTLPMCQGQALLDQLRTQADDSLVATTKHSPRNRSMSVLEQLQRDLQQMYRIADTVTGHRNEADWSGSGTSSSAQMKEDAHTGLPYAEVHSAMRVQCDYREAGMAMWLGTSPHSKSVVNGKTSIVVSVVLVHSVQEVLRYEMS